MFPTITKLLLEVTMQQVKQRFKSKRFLRASKLEQFELDPRDLRLGSSGPNIAIENWLLMVIPHDIEEQQKAEALDYIISLFIGFHKPNAPRPVHHSSFVGWLDDTALEQSLETFFQIKTLNLDHLLPEKELPKYTWAVPHKFENDMQWAAVRLRDHEAAKVNPTFAAKGAELIGETGEWKIYIPRNKAAACKLGSNTGWCTASPGLKWYEQYHSDDDPLIIFKHKHDEKKDVQLWFNRNGDDAGQFNDVRNGDIDDATFQTLLQVLAHFKHKLPTGLWDYIESMYVGQEFD